MTDLGEDEAWEQRVSEAWSTFEERTDAENRAVIETLAAERPDGSAEASFERACVLDSTGASELAVPLYREALARGLGPERRRRAVIQLASSLRNVGRTDESVALLTGELGAESDELDDAVRAFLALALTDAGRDREAVCHALTALAPHLPRYQRSLTAYARGLVDEDG